MTSPSEDTDPIWWARYEAARLRQFDVTSYLPKGPRATAGTLAPAAELLTKCAGPSSEFAAAAHRLAESLSPWAEAHAMADLLEGWANFQETGLASSPPFEVRARVEAASDLMEQVEILLSDRNVHPVAPIVISGAALEERLRALVLQHGCNPSGKGIDAYGAALKAAGVVDGQEAKQVMAWAGLRNRAAHGEELNTLTTTEARIMADGINFFLQKHDEG